MEMKTRVTVITPLGKFKQTIADKRTTIEVLEALMKKGQFVLEATEEESIIIPHELAAQSIIILERFEEAPGKGQYPTPDQEPDVPSDRLCSECHRERARWFVWTFGYVYFPCDKCLLGLRDSLCDAENPILYTKTIEQHARERKEYHEKY